jgi:PAS domain S-box-containing protein
LTLPSAGTPENPLTGGNDDEARRDLYETAFRLSPFATNLTSLQDQKIMEANEGFLKFTGYALEEVLGRTVAELGLWVEPAQRLELVNAIQRDGAFSDREGLLRMKDGSVRAGLMSGRVVSVRGQPCVLTVTRDITRQREMEAAATESERTFRALFDCIQDAIYIQDAHGRFLDVNRGAEVMYRLSRESLVGQTPELVSAPGLNDLAAVAAMVRKALGGEPQGFEFWGKRSTGEVFPKEVHLYPGTYAGQQVVIATARDISQRKKLEEHQLQAQKLESLGVLAGGIAHDFNNLLTTIMGNVALAQRGQSSSSRERVFLQNAETALVKAAQLTKQMLAYSGRGRFVVKVLDLNQLVREMLQLLHVSISRRVELVMNLAADLPGMRADAAQLQQVVMNLVTNASEAMADQGGSITVSTRAADLGAEQMATFRSAQGMTPGRFVVLEVEDTGCGMTQEVMGRIFDPFFTTKASGRGLGLSAMLGILRGHGAGIHIRSAVGQGSCFQVYFPATSDAQAPADGRSTRRARASMEGRVLLVDDQEEVLLATGAMLRALGFEVVEARDGQQALDVLKRELPSVTLVLMDLTMPGMDGQAAFREMHRLHPQVPVVLTSGYDHMEVTETLQEHAPAGFIQKPYGVEDLEVALRAILARVKS